MASTDQGRRLTAGHRAAQARIGAETARQMSELWVLLNTEARSLSVNQWVEACLIVLGHRFDLSAGAARAYYTAFRLAEIGEAGFAARQVPTLPLDATRASLIAKGPARFAAARRRGLAVSEASRLARVEAARESIRIALDGGRQQILLSSGEDDEAVGWARVTDGSPCAFCAMLASRGPVYKTRRTSHFSAHASCGCSAEPFFSRQQPWPPGAREFKELWNVSTTGERDQLNAFRRAYEGR